MIGMKIRFQRSNNLCNLKKYQSVYPVSVHSAIYNILEIASDELTNGIRNLATLRIGHVTIPGEIGIRHERPMHSSVCTVHPYPKSIEAEKK